MIDPRSTVAASRSATTSDRGDVVYALHVEPARTAGSHGGGASVDQRTESLTDGGAADVERGGQGVFAGELRSDGDRPIQDRGPQLGLDLLSPR